MALFKVNRGNSTNLPEEKHDGWAYFCTDTGEFFIDYKDENEIIQRKQINAAEASKILGYDIVDAIGTVEGSEVEIPTTKAVMDQLGGVVKLPVRGAVITLAEALIEAMPELADGEQHTIEFSTEEDNILESVLPAVTTNIEEHNADIAAHPDIRQVIDEQIALVKEDMPFNNGEAYGSAHSIGALKESDDYKLGQYAFAEGQNTTASGKAAHAEGTNSVASGENAHAEGSSKASGIYAHAEGADTEASGLNSHAEGIATKASGNGSHAEGFYTHAASDFQNVQGRNNIVDSAGKYLHIVGNGEGGSEGLASNAHTLDWDGNAWFAGDVYVGSTSGTDKDEGSVKLQKAIAGIQTEQVVGFDADGNAVAQSAIGRPGGGENAEIFNNYENNTANGTYSHAEGGDTEASGPYTHAEGFKTVSSGVASHSEGMRTIASHNGAHAEGSDTTASGLTSHAEGCLTNATGENAHAEGSGVTASALNSHAEGRKTEAASREQHVQGRFNIVDANGVYQHIVGNGDINNSIRSNAHTLDWSGNAWFAGDVYVGSTSGTDKDDGSVKLATVNDVANLKDDLLNGAGEAYDTLKELGELIDENTDAIDALNTVAASKVSNTTTINGHALSSNVTLAATDVGADAAGTAASAVSAHDSSTSAHADIRALIDALTPRITTVTLAAGSWSNSTQTVTVNGVLADATKQVINVSPVATSSNIEAISSAGAYATAQGTNTITFTCMNDVPTVNIQFIVQFQNAITI